MRFQDYEEKKLEVEQAIDAAERAIHLNENIATSISAQNHQSMQALALAQIATAKAIMLQVELHDGL